MADKFLFPTTMAELDGMLTNQVPESIYLDYKASGAVDSTKISEIAKDVSAFANSDGGVLIYGVGEDKANRIFVKDSGVDRKRYTGDWFEHILQSGISPRISGIEIKDIPASSNRSYFALKIPRSTGTAYQERETKKFYKRFELNSVPMEEYEINDLRARSALVPRLVTFGVEPRHGFLAYFVISNIGSFPARNVTFEFSHVLSWPEGQKRPSIFDNGIRYLPQGKQLWCRYHSFPDLLFPGTPLSAFHSADHVQ